MPYAIRNSIILAVLLVLFTGAGGGYIYLYQDKKIAFIRKEHESIRVSGLDKVYAEAVLRVIFDRSGVEQTVRLRAIGGGWYEAAWARPADVLAERVLRHRQGFQSGWAFAAQTAVE